MTIYNSKYFNYYVVIDELIYSGFNSRIDAMIRYVRARDEGFPRVALLTKSGLEKRGIDPSNNKNWLQYVIQQDNEDDDFAEFINTDTIYGDYDDFIDNENEDDENMSTEFEEE